LKLILLLPNNFLRLPIFIYRVQGSLSGLLAALL
jgi:hypothetical protein